MGSPNQRKTIVLIGSTGSGKSSLGNCLLEPSKTSGPKVFVSGCGRIPESQRAQVGVGHCSRGVGEPPVLLKIIDTPGLNESAAKDQAHMIEIEIAVRNERKIAACLLCVKFNSQIDIQYKTTVQMYKQLLRLFEANLIVVFTDYSEHPRAMKKREREGIVPSVVIRNAIEAIVEAAELSYEPKYFCIDSLPPRENKDCVECTMVARRTIIEYLVMKTILLIGSTGHGKSTLGNCLLDPSEYPREVFTRGRPNVPQTQNVQMENGLLRLGAGKCFPLQIIDTPGLNESTERDLTHMIEIIESMRKLKEITACLLCVKFNTQIDVQYRATVRYYRSLLPELFEANVIVVFTDYSENPYEVRKREREGIKPVDVIDNAIAAIVEAAELPFTPTYFCIDSLPLADEDMKYTMEARGAILGYVGTLSGVDTSYLLVAKTPALQAIDRERVKELDGQITGYNQKIKQIKKEAGTVLDHVVATSKKCTELEADRLDANEELKTTDTDQLLPVK